VKLVEHELRQRAAAGFIRPLLLEGQQVPLHNLIEDRLPWLPARPHRAGR